MSQAVGLEKVIFFDPQPCCVPSLPEKKGVVTGAAKEEKWTSDYVDDNGEAVVFTTFAQVKGCNKKLSDCCQQQKSTVARSWLFIIEF